MDCLKATYLESTTTSQGTAMQPTPQRFQFEHHVLDDTLLDRQISLWNTGPLTGVGVL